MKSKQARDTSGDSSVSAAGREERSRGRVRRGLRTAGRSLAASAIVILILEAVLRVGAWAWHGGSDYYLLYGFHSLVGRVGISPWTVFNGEPYKFPPDYVLEGAAGQGEETAQTNSLGFRGGDFNPRKQPDTFRIIALGGSSTFGFHNTDTGTYPYQLQERFRGDSLGLRVEVINAGFPYYHTGTIRRLLEDELLAYEPDVLTLYSAYNDVGWPLKPSFALRAMIWLQQHSIIYLTAKETVLTDLRIYKLKSLIRRKLGSSADPSWVDRRSEQISARYRENLDWIADVAEERGIRFVLIRQPMSTRTNNRRPNPLSYEEEYQRTREKLANGEYLSGFDLQLLGHRGLIRELDAIAAERGIPVVDNIRIVDEDRSRLSTYVHLTEEANGLLADAMKELIAPYVLEEARRRVLTAEAPDATGSDATDAASVSGAARTTTG